MLVLCMMLSGCSLFGGEIEFTDNPYTSLSGTERFEYGTVFSDTGVVPAGAEKDDAREARQAAVEDVRACVWEYSVQSIKPMSIPSTCTDCDFVFCVDVDFVSLEKLNDDVGEDEVDVCESTLPYSVDACVAARNYCEEKRRQNGEEIDFFQCPEDKLTYVYAYDSAYDYLMMMYADNQFLRWAQADFKQGTLTYQTETSGVVNASLANLYDDYIGYYYTYYWSGEATVSRTEETSTEETSTTTTRAEER